MSDLQLRSGAYLISNKQTEACLEIRGGSDRVWMAIKDAYRRREQQIWWVETIPEYEDEEEGPLYSISNLPHALGLDSRAWKEKGLEVATNQISGLPWQKWWIRRVPHDTEGEFYNIINYSDKGTLDIDPSKPVDSVVRTSEFAAENNGQRWEFVIPIVGIPPGWLQIRNVADGSVLQQTYLTSPPFLAPELTLSTPPTDRRNWGSQWLFLLEDGKADSPQCYWSIKNRLTGGFLRQQEVRDKNGRIINISAGGTWKLGSDCPYQMWSFQMHRDGYWRIVSKKNSWVLEKVDEEGTELRAARKDIGGGNGRRWEFLERNRARQDCKAAEEKPPAHRAL